MEDNQKVHQQGNNRGLKSILAILIIIAIGLASGVIFFHFYNSEYRTWEREFGAIDSEQLSNSVSYYIFDNGSKKNELQTYLEQSIEQATTSSDLVNSCQYLATLLESDKQVDKAAETLESCLNNTSINLAPEGKSLLLTQLLSIYQSQNDIPAQITTLKRAIELPDDMILEGQDWQELKPLLIEQLKTLEEKNNVTSE